MTKFKKGHKGFWLGKLRPNLHSDEAREKISLGNKGKELSQETKDKISDFNRGKIVSEETKKKISDCRKGLSSPAKGHKWSLESRLKFSESQRGEKSHCWKGGLKPVNKRIRGGVEFRLWREAVYARDGWTCQITGVKGGSLIPHHLKNFAEYPELRFAIDNGVTLCKEIHTIFHKMYGYTNNTLEQFINFKENFNPSDWKEKLWKQTKL